MCFPRDPLLRPRPSTKSSRTHWPNHRKQDEGASDVYERDAGQYDDRDDGESLQESGRADCEEDLQTIYVVEDLSGDELNNLAYFTSYIEAHKFMNKVIEYRDEVDKKFNADSKQYKRYPRKHMHSLDLSVEEYTVFETAEQAEKE